MQTTPSSSTKASGDDAACSSNINSWFTPRSSIGHTWTDYFDYTYMRQYVSSNQCHIAFLRTTSLLCTCSTCCLVVVPWPYKRDTHMKHARTLAHTCFWHGHAHKSRRLHILYSGSCAGHADTCARLECPAVRAASWQAYQHQHIRLGLWLKRCRRRVPPCCAIAALESTAPPSWIYCASRQQLPDWSLHSHPFRQPRTLLPVEQKRGTRKHCRQECMACRPHAPHVSVQRLVAEALHRLAEGACQALADLPPLSSGGMASGPASCRLLAGCMDKSSALPRARWSSCTRCFRRLCVFYCYVCASATGRGLGWREVFQDPWA